MVILRLIGSVSILVSVLTSCSSETGFSRLELTDTPTTQPETTPIPSETAALVLSPTATASSTATPTPHPLTMEAMRSREYPGSDLIIEQTLEPGANYYRYIASYLSEGLKIFGLLTVPYGNPPEGGWPMIIFNHGYIPPDQYQTTERYVAHVNSLASNGYVVFKPDYRGHGDSEGSAVGGYASPAYTIDVLNAKASVQRFPGVNPDKVGMWGHSMGGHLTLRAMVTVTDIKAGVIWAGVVASYPDLLTNWRRSRPTQATPGRLSRIREDLIGTYGSWETNPEFWASISPIDNVSDISGPLELHHGTADSEVPIEFSESLYQAMLDTGREVEFYTYPGSDHNIAQSYSTAMQRTVEFFNRYLK